MLSSDVAEMFRDRVVWFMGICDHICIVIKIIKNLYYYYYIKSVLKRTVVICVVVLLRAPRYEGAIKSFRYNWEDVLVPLWRDINTRPVIFVAN